MNVTQARPGDLPDLLELVAEYQQLDENITEIDDERNARYLTEILGNERLGCVLIGRTSSGQPVGFVSIFLTPHTLHAEQVPEIRDLFVTESMRRKGFGRLLFTHAVRWAKSNKHRRLIWEIETMNLTAQYLFDIYETETEGRVSYAMNLEKRD